MVATILQILPALNQGGVERGTVEIDNALVACRLEFGGSFKRGAVG